MVDDQNGGLCFAFIDKGDSAREEDNHQCGETLLHIESGTRETKSKKKNSAWSVRGATAQKAKKKTKPSEKKTCIDGEVPDSLLANIGLEDVLAPVPTALPKWRKARQVGLVEYERIIGGDQINTSDLNEKEFRRGEG